MDRHDLRTQLDQIAASGDSWFTVTSQGDGERYTIRDSAAGEAVLTLDLAWVTLSAARPAGDDAQQVLEAAAASRSLMRAWVESGSPPRLVVEGRIYYDSLTLQSLFLTVRDVLRVLNASSSAQTAPYREPDNEPSSGMLGWDRDVTAPDSDASVPDAASVAPPDDSADTVDRTSDTLPPTRIPSVTATLPPVMADEQPVLAAGAAPVASTAGEPTIEEDDDWDLEPPEAVPPPAPPSAVPSDPYAYRPVSTSAYDTTPEPAAQSGMDSASTPTPPEPEPVPSSPPVGKTVLIARRPPEELEPPAETPPAPASTVVITRSVTSPPAPLTQRSAPPPPPAEQDTGSERVSSTSDTLPPTHMREEPPATPPTVVVGRDVWSRPGETAETAPPAATPRCPRCNATVLPTDRFCMSCGRPLMHGAPPPVGQPPVAPVTEATATCARCGASNPAHFRFCQSCGGVLAIGATVPISVSPPADRGISCPHCSYLNPADNRFCQGCGRPLAS